MFVAPPPQTEQVKDDSVILEIADNVRVRVARSMIVSLLSKTEPVADMPEKTEKEAKKQAPRMALKKAVVKKTAPKAAVKKPEKKKTVATKK